jgi:hypothetical protein
MSKVVARKMPAAFLVVEPTVVTPQPFKISYLDGTLQFLVMKKSLHHLQPADRHLGLPLCRRLNLESNWSSQCPQVVPSFKTL